MLQSSAFVVSILILPIGVLLQRPDCSRLSYDRCIQIADPLVKEGHLVIPDNMNDIDIVCRTWSTFVDCLNVYTESCFTDDQRRKFNKAVENPIGSIHQMCLDTSYQKEYLLHAPCIKSLVTERQHCGLHYNLLVEQVSQGDIISKSTLCCSHERFKQCVLSETRRVCDRGLGNGPAARFSNQIIEKALSFLQDQCYNYIPNSGDCTSSTTDSQAFSDPLTISTSSSEVYPWSTIQEMNAKEIIPSRVTPPRTATTTPWLPSSTLSVQTSPDPSSTQQQILGSRTRPASYGRSSSWSSTQPPNQNFGPSTYPSITSPRSIWTTTHWQPKGSLDKNDILPDDPTRSGTTWYPAAGDQLVNEVDEPNQQGLTKSKNNSGTQLKLIPSFLISILIFVMFC